MPIVMHFLSRHAWHWLRWALSTTQRPVPAWHLWMKWNKFDRIRVEAINVEEALQQSTSRELTKQDFCENWWDAFEWKFLFRQQIRFRTGFKARNCDICSDFCSWCQAASSRLEVSSKVSIRPKSGGLSEISHERNVSGRSCGKIFLLSIKTSLPAHCHSIRIQLWWAFQFWLIPIKQTHESDFLSRNHLRLASPTHFPPINLGAFVVRLIKSEVGNKTAIYGKMFPFRIQSLNPRPEIAFYDARVILLLHWEGLLEAIGETGACTLMLDPLTQSMSSLLCWQIKWFWMLTNWCCRLESHFCASYSD